MNLTFSVDQLVLERAREVARGQGTTVEALIRSYLESLAGMRSGDEVADQLKRLWSEAQGHSGGMKIGRDDAYKGRIS